MEEQKKRFAVMGNRDTRLYYKVLESARKEFLNLEPLLPKYAQEDLEMFRIKVHGIKGVAGQIGQSEFGRTAENLEIAAKTENRAFITENLENFLQELREICKKLETELSYRPKEKPSQTESGLSKEELLAKLKASFEDYDFEMIEQWIAKLENKMISKEEICLLENVKEACAQMDYEEGIRLLEKS